MPRRERTRRLLRGLAKLVGVVLVAGAAGVLLGIGLSQLTGDDETPAPAAPASIATTANSAATPPPTTSVRSTTSTSSRPAGTAAPLAKVRVRVLGTVLHSARTPSGIQRRRARVAVRVRAENTGTASVTLGRPSIIAAGETVKSDAQADSPQTNFGALGAAQTRAVTLRFETAGAVTAQLTDEKTGQLRIAGRTIDLTIKVGAPLSRSG